MLGPSPRAIASKRVPGLKEFGPSARFILWPYGKPGTTFYHLRDPYTGPIPLKAHSVIQIYRAPWPCFLPEVTAIASEPADVRLRLIRIGNEAGHLPYRAPSRPT